MPIVAMQSIVTLSVVMPSDILFSIVILNVMMALFCNAERHYGYCHYDECLSIR